MLKRLFVVLFCVLILACGGSSAEDNSDNLSNGFVFLEGGGETGSEFLSPSPENTGVNLCEGMVCNPTSSCMSSSCVSGACVETALVGQPCYNGDACTLDDLCGADGLCVSGAPRDCADGNPCTVNTCDSTIGCVTSFAENGVSCVDGSLCTQDDACTAGLCQGTAIECPTSSLGCQTATGCDPNTGTCSYEMAVDGTVCDDGDACSTADSCSVGVCSGMPLIDCFYLAAPNASNCYEGILSDERKQDALDELNWIRAHHGLAAVVYDASSDVATQKSALMMSVNSDLDHHPPTHWACWSSEGDQVSSKSNLSIQWGWENSGQVAPEEEIRGWMVDYNVYSLGHRRWLMDPFLRAISFGSVDGPPLVGSNYPWAHASVIQVMWDESADISGQETPQLIAYPMGDYPAPYMETGWFLSASVLMNSASRWANDDVSFAQASISVQGPNGSLNVYDVSANNSGYGIPNHVQWRVEGLNDGVEYTVTMNNVWVNGSWETFTYSFRLI